MSSGSKLVLPGTFTKGTNYILKGETLIAWQQALLKDRVIAGNGITESQQPEGRVLTAMAGEGGGSITGSFHRQFKADGKFMLQGGQVMGGTGNVVVGDISLTASSTPSVNDRVVYLKVGVKPNIFSNRIYGINVSSAEAVTNATLPLPAHTMPVVTAPDDESFVHLLLGTWTDGVFYTSLLPGGFNVTYCNTGYTITKLPS